MQMFRNDALTVAFMSWAAAQLIKIVTDVVKQKKVNLSLILSSGGMPSSHSSFVVSVATYVGYANGFDSYIFAVAAVLAIVVMYDAAGVRRAAGKQAAAINALLEKENPELNEAEKFNELLGHKPIEVFFGAILGFIIASGIYYYRIVGGN